MPDIGKIADKLGYDYTGRFQLEPFEKHRNTMPWYYTYGIFSINYFFDRLQPRNKYSHAAKIIVQTLYAMIYALPIGTPLSLAGNIYDRITPSPQIPENPYRD